jgi:hypothetical protein
MDPLDLMGYSLKFTVVKEQYKTHELVLSDFFQNSSKAFLLFFFTNYFSTRGALKRGSQSRSWYK